MAAVLQIKATEANRLRVELENISHILSENMTQLTNSILNNRSREMSDCMRAEVKEEAENLLMAYESKGNAVSSPALSVRLGDAIRKYSGAVLAGAIVDIVEAKTTHVPEHLSGDTSFSTLDKLGASSIDKRYLEHIGTYATCKKMLSRIRELEQQRDELKKKTKWPSALHRAALDGLKAKRACLEGQLAALKAREQCVDRLRQEVQEAARFSTDFERRFAEKKSQLVCARNCLNSLSSDASSLKSLALGRFDCVVNSINRLSALLKELRTLSGDGGINLGASAAMDISRLARLPRLSTCDAPYLYNEICKRLKSTPFVTPVEKVVERIHQIIVDVDNFELVNNELDSSLKSMRELRDVLRPSLEKMEINEKEVCTMMATALKKITSLCAKTSEKQKHLEELWKHWSEWPC